MGGLLQEIRTRNEPAQNPADREMLGMIENLRTRLIDSHGAALDPNSDVITVRLNQDEGRLLYALITDSGPMYGSNPNPVELGNLVILARRETV